MIAHSLDARVWTILMDFSIILSCTDSNLKDTRTRKGLKWCACLPEGNNQAKRNNEMIEDYIFVCLEINFVTDFFFLSDFIGVFGYSTPWSFIVLCPFTKFYAFIEYKRHWNLCFIFGDIPFFMCIILPFCAVKCVEAVVRSVHTLLSDLLKEWSIQQVDRLVPIMAFFHHTDDVIHQICNWSQNNWIFSTECFLHLSVECCEGVM